MPWSVVSNFLNNMLPDASPHHQPTPIVQIEESEESLPHKIVNSVSASVSQTKPSLDKQGKDL